MTDTDTGLRRIRQRRGSHHGTNVASASGGGVRRQRGVVTTDVPFRMEIDLTRVDEQL
ncbi:MULTISPECIES: hypothetical protein [Streptomyces]|uniref:hypothetical protein n=1 Tax=Streptomyces TaxID=1883 RepID=UPI00324FA7C9